MTDLLNRTEYLRTLRGILNEKYDESHLRLLAADLNLDWDNLPGEIKELKCHSIIQSLAKEGRLEDLQQFLVSREISLPEIPSAVEQKGDIQEISMPDSGCEKIYQDYTHYIQTMLLEHRLRKSKPSDDVRNLVQVQTIDVLERLDRSRKQKLIRFLSGELKLVGKGGLLNLRRANLHLVDLEKIDFREVDLTEADLSEANLQWANLTSANLTSANLCGTDLTHTKLSKAKLKSTRFNGYTKINPKWRTVWMIVNAGAADSDFSGKDLSQADLSGIHLPGAKLSGAVLFRSDLSRSSLKGGHFEAANLSETNLCGSDLSYADLREANLSHSDLSDAILFHTSLQNANLSEANLCGTDLSFADLSSAKLNHIHTSEIRDAEAWMKTRMVKMLRWLSKFYGRNYFTSLANRIHVNRTQFHGAILDGVEINDSNISPRQILEAKSIRM